MSAPDILSPRSGAGVERVRDVDLVAIDRETMIARQTEIKPVFQFLITPALRAIRHRRLRPIYLMKYPDTRHAPSAHMGVTVSTESGLPAKWVLN